jgi:hypothetical protein
MEAQAQTVELIGAATETAAWYTTQAGVAAGTLLIVWAVTLVVAYLGLKLLLKRLEERDAEIAELKVTCAKEIAQAKLDAEADVEKRFQTAWQRVGEIFGSVGKLFEKVDTSNTKVADTLKALELTLAKQGIIAK